MSDDPKPIDGGSEWTMPKPIFRTSEGYTPRKPPLPSDPDDVDTASPGFEPPSHDDIDTEIPGLDPDKISADTPDALISATPNSVRAAPVKAAKGGCARGIVIIGGAVAFLALAVVAVAIYLLYFYHPAETSTF